MVSNSTWSGPRIEAKTRPSRLHDGNRLHLLAPDFSRYPVAAKRNEPWVTKSTLRSPLKEFDRRHQLRLEPAAALHVFGGQAFAPSALSRFGKIAKRAFGDR